MRISSFVLTGVLVVSAACSGGSKTAPGPTASSVTINLRDVVLAGLSVVATATATMSNGQTQPVTTGWRSDATTVATITDGGSVSALANGEVTVSVSFNGASASKRIRVAPNYDGRWQGSQVVTRCAATGAFEGFCEDGGSIVGLSFPVGMTARHPSDLTVSGEFTIEGLAFPTFTTGIESDGRIAFSSATTVDVVRVESSWALNSSTVGRANGTIREIYSAPSVAAGDITIDSTVSNLPRSAADLAYSTRGRIWDVRARLQRVRR